MIFTKLKDFFFNLRKKGKVSQTRRLTSLILCQSQSAATLGAFFHVTLQKQIIKTQGKNVMSKGCSFAINMNYKTNKKEEEKLVLRFLQSWFDGTNFH